MEQSSHSTALARPQSQRGCGRGFWGAVCRLADTRTKLIRERLMKNVWVWGGKSTSPRHPWPELVLRQEGRVHSVEGQTTKQLASAFGRGSPPEFRDQAVAARAAYDALHVDEQYRGGPAARLRYVAAVLQFHCGSNTHTHTHTHTRARAPTYVNKSHATQQKKPGPTLRQWVAGSSLALESF